MIIGPKLDTNFDDGYEYESDKEDEYDHLFNKSEG